MHSSNSNSLLSNNLHELYDNYFLKQAKSSQSQSNLQVKNFSNQIMETDLSLKSSITFYSGKNFDWYFFIQFF